MKKCLLKFDWKPHPKTDEEIMRAKRSLRDTCNFTFKGPWCKYRGKEKECNKTIERCKELNNFHNLSPHLLGKR